MKQAYQSTISQLPMYRLEDRGIVDDNHNDDEGLHYSLEIRSRIKLDFAAG